MIDKQYKYLSKNVSNTIQLLLRHLENAIGSPHLFAGLLSRINNILLIIVNSDTELLGWQPVNKYLNL